MAQRLTASNLVAAINRLPRSQSYNYVNPQTNGQISIEAVTLPEGPISIRRWDSSKGSTRSSKKTETISTEMIWRLANALSPGQPIQVDRVFGGSYNTRSVLEALVAHTPEFYHCRPGRIETMNSAPQIRKGHKHIVWLPDNPHKAGVLAEIQTDAVISEVPSQQVVYDSLTLPGAIIATSEEELAFQRRHVQIQYLLVRIGQFLGYRTWVAANDRATLVGTTPPQRMLELEGVIEDLEEMKVISAYDQGVHAAHLIDCVWFKNGRLMPAVMEIEHSTGVKSGLTRMLQLKDLLPPYANTRWVIVAPDEDREKVVTSCKITQFKSLDARYFPYSAVEELYALCNRRNLNSDAVNEAFLDCFIERIA